MCICIDSVKCIICQINEYDVLLFFQIFVFSPSFCIHHPSLHSFPILSLQTIYTVSLSPLLPLLPLLPTAAIFYFPNFFNYSMLYAHFWRLKQGNTDKREHAKSVVLDLGYFTQYDVS